MENLDLTKILKNVPKGTVLYSVIHGDIYFDSIVYNDKLYPIHCHGINGEIGFTSEGKWHHNYNGECILFPSRDQRDWSKFNSSCQFKLGDVLIGKNGHYLAIFNKNDRLPRNEANVLYYSCYYGIQDDKLEINIGHGIGTIDDYKYANVQEKTILFDKLKDAGYFWNPVTKSLEKYKFKIGDKIRNIHTRKKHKVRDIGYTGYILGDSLFLKCTDQDQYTLDKFDPKTLKPYDKVLVRLSNSGKWTPQIFSYLETSPEGHYYGFVLVGDRSAPQCIPYEGNEHLVRTYKNCDDYYKTWK